MKRLNDATPAEWDAATNSRGWVPDPVNNPSHYTQGKWEAIEVLEEFFGEDPLLWQVGKYILRHEHKGNSIQDLEKAAWYLNRKINKLKGN
ncbi:SaV-like [uncultured Caudovirales phage]|uniref:SaV-like n=1 Tax=uncultured Caudovirales phage TaxID=2100421 RepID=A0A6J5LCH1_9CAUD|nr:SaV-like [uncultured Caudovirales phage]